MKKKKKKVFPHLVKTLETIFRKMGSTFSRFLDWEEDELEVHRCFTFQKPFLEHSEHTNVTEENPNGHNSTKLFIIAIKRLNIKKNTVVLKVPSQFCSLKQ